MKRRYPSDQDFCDYLKLPNWVDLGMTSIALSIAEVTEGDSLDPSYAYPLHLHLLVPSLNRSIDCYAAALN